MGQILNPAYIFLNVFGLTLVAKLQAEQYIRKSGINYTIIRPGGLRNEPPTGNIIMEPEVMAYVVRLKNIFATLSSAKNSVAFLSINYYSSQKKIYSVASLSLCPL
jgi:hypothetical protein